MNAKVIFGTVRDDKLKKNEVKITVIAAGFPEGIIPTGENKNASNNNPENKQSFNQVNETKPKPVNTSIPLSVKDIPVPIREEKKESKNDNNDDDDWGAVPAFLRRSKLK